MNKAEELIDLVSNWSNAEKAQAINLLKSSMAESVSTRTPKSEVADYLKITIKQGLTDGTIKDYPGELNREAKSLFYREVIKTVVKDMRNELLIDDSSESLKLAWEHCEKAKTLIDFRKAFKMYCTILKSETYTVEDLQEYAETIDELSKEVRKLREYKRIYDEIFKIADETGQEESIVLQAKTLKNTGMSDKEICKVLDIDRNRLNYCRRKIGLEP